MGQRKMRPFARRNAVPKQLAPDGARFARLAAGAKLGRVSFGASDHFAAGNDVRTGGQQVFEKRASAAAVAADINKSSQCETVEIVTVWVVGRGFRGMPVRCLAMPLDLI